MSKIKGICLLLLPLFYMCVKMAWLSHLMFAAHTHTRTHAHTHACTHTRTHMRAHTHIHKYTFMQIIIYTCTNICINTHTHIQLSQLFLPGVCHCWASEQCSEGRQWISAGQVPHLCCQPFCRFWEVRLMHHAHCVPVCTFIWKVHVSIG